MNAAPASIKIKVCGVSCVEDALTCARLGVDWIGLNFHPGSPRCISIETALQIVRALPSGCEPVALFVDASLKQIRATIEPLDISIVQLHGSEPARAIAELAGMRVVRALRVAADQDCELLCDHINECNNINAMPYAWLVDARDASDRDRAGRTIGDAMIERIASIRDRMGRVILAGGLTTVNVGQAVRRLRPWMVDVASGVEDRPGRKNEALLAAFVAAVREQAMP